LQAAGQIIPTTGQQSSVRAGLPYTHAVPAIPAWPNAFTCEFVMLQSTPPLPAATAPSIDQRDHYTKADLIDCAYGRLFPGDIRLPNNEMLMLDRITRI